MLWLKAFHIIFVVCWFAGIFYLPRLLVHHAHSDNADVRAHLAMMSRKLYRFITPFMFITIIIGIGLISTNANYYLQATWLWLKLACVAILVIYHFVCGSYVKRINAGREPHHHVYLRIFNEIPVLFLFAVVLLVVLKPFQ